jgi:hypothetical protein
MYTTMRLSALVFAAKQELPILIPILYLILVGKTAERLAVWIVHTPVHCMLLPSPLCSVSYNNRLCHPGPCPPCLIAGKHKQCYCGKESYRLKCGEIDKGMTCGNTCDKPLKCGKHRCQLDCHPGTSFLLPSSCLINLNE